MMARATRTRSLKRLIRPLVWIALTAAVVFALQRLPWQQAVREIASANLPWLVLSASLAAAILPLWAAEWQLLAPGRSVGFGRMFEIVALTASVLNSVPMLAGEASAVGLLIVRGGLSRGAAISVLAMDQLLVALAKVAVITAAALLAPIPDWLRTGLLALSGFLLAALVAAAALAHTWERLHASFGTARSRWRSLVGRAIGLGVHLEPLRHVGLAWRVSLLAVLKKALEVAGVMAVQVAFGLDPSLATSVLVVAALSISTLVPLAPGNLGVYEATVFAAYRFAGVPGDTALGLAVVQHVCFLLPSLLPGYIMLTLRQLRPVLQRAE